MKKEVEQITGDEEPAKKDNLTNEYFRSASTEHSLIQLTQCL